MKDSTASIYVRILAVLDLMRKRSDGIEITRWGQIILFSPPHAENIIREALTTLLMKKYLGFEVILRLVVESAYPISLEQVSQRCEGLFPRWGSLAAYRERLLWQRALELIELVDSPEIYRATPLGKAVSSDNTLRPAHTAYPLGTEAEWLGQRLIDASTDGANSDQFEMWTKQCLEFLGFDDVKSISGRGDTDLLINANHHDFRAIVDSKARSDRLNQFDVYAINEHRDKHNTSLAMIVAPDFGGGRVIRQAESNQIALLPVTVFSDWLLWHEETPFSITENIVIFEQVGLIEALPDIFTLRRVHQQKMTKLLMALFQLLHDDSTSQLGVTWTVNNLHAGLVVRSGEPFTSEQVQEALVLLQHPTVQAIEIGEEGVLHTTMTWKTFVARLFNLTRMLSELDNEFHSI
ncbi:MAG: hypothetical protein AAFQ57_13720 [Cyanobacteria bacterium J06626_14]